jgi:hypothetical protein
VAEAADVIQKRAILSLGHIGERRESAPSLYTNVASGEKGSSFFRIYLNLGEGIVATYSGNIILVAAPDFPSALADRDIFLRTAILREKAWGLPQRFCVCASRNAIN